MSPLEAAWWLSKPPYDSAGASEYCSATSRQVHDNILIASEYREAPIMHVLVE